LLAGFLSVVAMIISLSCNEINLSASNYNDL